jgi:hypothetical protein
MTTQFAAGRSQLPSLAAYITGSGNVMGGGATYYFFLQARSRCGYNQASESFSLVVTDNSTVGIVLPGVSYLASEDWHEFLIYANTDDDFSTAWLVGTYKALQANQQTKTTLGSDTPLSTDPKQLILSENYHLNFSSTVSNPSNLPVVPLQGMRRFITSLSRTYRYDADSTLTANGDTVLAATTGRWLYNGSSNLVENPTNLETDSNGCNQNINLVSGNPDLLLATYDVSGNTGIPICYYLKSASNTTIPKGTRILLSIRVDDLDVTDDFNLLFNIVVHGKVQTSNYALVTTNFFSAGSVVPYDHFTQNIILEDDILADEYLLISVQPEFSATDVDTSITPSVALSLYPYFAENTATYGDVNLSVGDLIFSEYQKRVCIPYGLGVLRVLEGSGCVGSYTWRNKGIEDLTGFTANTADQNVLVTRTGDVLLGSTTSLRLRRALFSTVIGYSTPCVFSSTVSITSGQTVNYTLNIERDVDGYNPISATYNDPLLRGLAGKAKLNTNKIQLIVKVDSVYKGFVITIDPTATSVTGTISDWSSGTTLDIGDINDYAAGLFTPQSATQTISGTGGTIPSGTVSIAYCFYYDGSAVTDISHSVLDGCIRTQDISFALLDTRYNYYGEPVSTVADLRALEQDDFVVGQQRLVLTNNYEYFFDSTSTDTDDGLAILKPDHIDSGDAGRWLIKDINAWFTGTTVPDNALGRQNNFYFRTDTSDLYRKGASTWSLLSNINGSIWRTGSGVPSDSLGINKDYYLDTATSNIYYKASGVYTLVANIKGATGDTGAAGAVWRSGSGVPDNATGINGDYYLRTSNGDVYYRSSGTYSVVTNIQGIQGSVWRNGSGVPSSGLGIDGDYYLDAATQDVYYKATGAYTIVTNILGAAGIVTASSGVIIEEGTAPTTSTDEIGLYNVANVLKYREESNGASNTVAVLEKQQSYTKAQTVLPSTLTDASTITVDAALSNVFDVTITDSRILGNPTNLTDGQTLVFRIKEDSTGTRVLTFASAYDFGVDTPSTDPIAADTMDILTCVSNGTKLHCSLPKKGYTY